MTITLDGQNLSRVMRHFREEEHISVSDSGRIVADAAAVLEKCIPTGTHGESKGLIYGNIQSGKTAVILALIAIAADNGYQRFLVLTSDLNDLYDQTLDRTRNTLHGLSVVGKTGFRAPPSGLLPPSVLVVSKNVKVLRQAQRIVSDPSWRDQSVMIIDDEADQASLDTTVNRPARGPSGVNRGIIALRQACPALAFVQTTATPQALLLQDAGTPFKPDFVRVTTPGAGYCGGDVFFIREDFNNPRYLRFVQPLDVVQLRTSQQLPASLEDALSGFLVGAALLRLAGTPTNYQALVHTSLKQAEHRLVTQLVMGFATAVALALGEWTAARVSGQALTPASQRLLQGLQRAYLDMSTGAAGTQLPPPGDVLAEIAGSIHSTTVTEINSGTGEGVQSNPNRRHVINVGGTKLGRGVTLKKLLMTYYARDAQRPQMDTVLQHARMYGYRHGELPYTRIWIPPHLADRFLNIHRADNAMRERALATGSVIPVIPLPIRNLRPSRSNVLSQRSVELTTYIGGAQYYPLVPVSVGSALASQTSALDRELGAAAAQERHAYDVTIDDVIRFLENRTFGAPDAPGAWDDDLIRQALNLLRADLNYANEAQLVVGSRSTEVAKLATRGTIPQIQALLPGGAGNPAYGTRTDRPVLVFMRLRGAVAAGWEGAPFWVPLVQFPTGNYAFSLNRT